MGSPIRFAENFDCYPDHIVATDIGGTNVTGKQWIKVEGEVIFLGSVAADYTDAAAVCQVLQASDSAGTGSKNITALTVTADAAGEDFKITVQAKDLDVDNKFTHVKLKITEAVNGGVDYVSCVAIATARYKHSGLSATELTDIV